jgi:ABC-2 type transport system ATP-binding protein
MTSAAIEVSEVWKSFRLYQEKNQYIKAALLRGRRARYEEFWAIQDVSFEVPFGSTFGIIGSNGSGKSTMLKCLAKILYPNKGSVSVNGRLAALLELGAGFHYELSGRENIFLNGAILGMSRKDLANRYEEIVEFAGLERFIDTPVKNYSSGMIVRLGFAIAVNVEPEILLIDEVLSVGDQSFQRKSIDKIDSFRKDGRTIVVVSHSTSQLQQLCKNIAWLEKGELRMMGEAHDVIASYSESSYQTTGDSVTTTAPSSGRWGTKAALIDHVEVFNGAGDSIDVSYTNDALQLSIDISAPNPIPDPEITISISTSSGIGLWSSSSNDANLMIGKLFGTQKINISIPHLRLMEGTYIISVSLHNRLRSVEYDHIEEAHRLNVTQGSVLGAGLLSMESSWRFVEPL